VLIAVVIAPALAKSTGRVSGIDYMTYLAIGTAALVVPLSYFLVKFSLRSGGASSGRVRKHP
jgi:hypothetical protein